MDYIQKKLEEHSQAVADELCSLNQSVALIRSESFRVHQNINLVVERLDQLDDKVDKLHFRNRSYIDNKVRLLEQHYRLRFYITVSLISLLLFTMFGFLCVETMVSAKQSTNPDLLNTWQIVGVVGILSSSLVGVSQAVLIYINSRKSKPDSSPNK